MGSICLSAPSILRCETFTTLQVKLLIVPTAIEVIFSTSLIITNRGTGWRHLLLTAEGWAYFALVILDLLSHILPAAREKLEVFRIFDLVLAATSFLPIFFYTLFIYLFARAELLKTLPHRFQTISRLMLVIFIPAIVSLSEISSFIGISYRTHKFAINGIPVPAIGFRTVRDETLWTFFTSLTLALLTAFQAINFVFAFYRLIRAIIEKRRIEASADDQAFLFGGTAWIAGGLKLGALETVLGFVQGGFGGAFTRRMLRFLARAFLCIGLAKGLDTAEDFAQVRDEMTRSNRKELRRSRLRQFISNPRFSSFRQLSPTATAFHAAPQAPSGLSRASTRSEDELQGLRQFAEVRQKRNWQRVTVHFDSGPPTLHMRFSVLDFPGSTPIAEQVQSRPRSEWASPPSRQASLMSSPPSFVSPSVPTRAHAATASHRQYHSLKDEYSRGVSAYSVPDSLNAVLELTPQFPGLPSSISLPFQGKQDSISNGQPWQNPYPSSGGIFGTSKASTSALSHSSSFTQRRKPVPFYAQPIDPFEDEDEDAGVAIDRPAYPLGSGKGGYSSRSATTGYTPSTGQVGATPDTENLFEYGTGPAGRSHLPPHHRSSQIGVALTSDLAARSVASPIVRPMSNLPTLAMVEGRTSLSSRASRGQSQTMRESLNEAYRGKSIDTLAIPPWLKSAEEEDERDTVRTFDRISNSANRTSAGTARRSGGGNPQLSRIKSVGRAPRRITPAPTWGGRPTRGSIYLEPIIIPPKEFYAGAEAVQGSLTSRDSRDSRGLLRDSGVLGMERGPYVTERGV